MKVKSLSHVRLFVTPCTVAYPVSPSMGFSRQEYWSGLPFPSPTHEDTSNLRWQVKPGKRSSHLSPTAPSLSKRWKTKNGTRGCIALQREAEFSLNHFSPSSFPSPPVCPCLPIPLLYLMYKIHQGANSTGMSPLSLGRTSTGTHSLPFFLSDGVFGIYLS